MRIFIDSRYRTPDSRSASDFTIELSESFQMPRDARIRIHDVSVPYAWQTVEEGLNQLLYVEELPTYAPAARRTISIPPGQYDGRTLAAAIATGLNTNHHWAPATNPYTVVYSDQTGTISVKLDGSLSGSWAFWPDSLLPAQMTWPGGDVNRPRSFNRNLRVSSLMYVSSLVTWRSQFVDLMTIKACYVTCSSLGPLSNVGPRLGQRNCLAKVAVTASYGYLIHSDGAAWEYAEGVGGQLVKRLSFRLEDVTGELVPLHGCDWSFVLTINDPLDLTA